MTSSDIIPIQNILTVTFATLVMVTYLDTAWDAVKQIACRHRLHQLQAMGLGLVMVTLGTILLRVYSFATHELGLDWMQHSACAIFAIGLQGTGFLILGVGFFMPRSSGATVESQRQARILRRGAFFSSIVLVTLSALKIIF